VDFSEEEQWIQAYFTSPSEFNVSLYAGKEQPSVSCIGNQVICTEIQRAYDELFPVLDILKLDNNEVDQDGKLIFPSGEDLGLLVLCVTASAIVVGYACLLLIRCWKKAQEDVRPEDDDTSSSGSESLEAPLITSSRDGESEDTATLTNFSGEEYLQNSISQSTQVPAEAKLVIPIMIFCTMGLFASANSSVGAAVNLDASIFGFFLGQYNVFNFSLINTITDMYDAKVYILAGLVTVWSGAWPYLKLLLLLLCWIVPPAYLSRNYRGGLLIFLDAMGKWCMLDAFLMCMMSVAFRFNIEVFSKRIFTLNVNVEELYGVFVFVVATILSLLLSHAVLAYHRNSKSSHRYKLFERERNYRKFCVPCPKGSWFDVGSMRHNRAADEKERLLKYVELSSCCKGANLSAVLNFVVFVTLIGCFVMICLGAFTNAFSFTFTGIAGKLIRIVEPEQVVREHSLVSIALSLSDEKVGGARRVGIIFLQTTYLLFALVMPLVLIIFLFALWFIPMTLRDQKIVFYVTEVVSAWNAVDVFIISILSSVVEINQFAQFLVGDRCDLIEKLLRERCFGVETKFLPGVWLIFTAALLLFISSRIIGWMSEKALSRRETRALAES